MSDLASSRPAADEPPDPRPGGPADVSGLFPTAAELFVPSAREPSDLDELALSPLAEIIADLADLGARDTRGAPEPSAPDTTRTPQPSQSADLAYHGNPGSEQPHPDAHGSYADGRTSQPDPRTSQPESRGPYPDGRTSQPDSRSAYPDGRTSQPDSRSAYSDFRGSYSDGDLVFPEGPPAADTPATPTGDPFDTVADGEPTARSIAALLGSPVTTAAELAEAVAWCYDDAALPLLLPLTRHQDAGVRRAVAQALPSVLGEAPPDDTVHALVRLSADRDDDVRDWACFALGTQLSEVDSATVRNALAARLDDPHDDTRCEALLGLARRRDARTLPVLHERLARDNVYSLEIDAAGALGHASLHTLVRGHLSGWDDDVVARVCAALRLTDPDGVGDDLLDGLTDWFRAGAPHATDEDRYWWSVTLQLLEHAEYRAPEIAEQVHYRLQSAEPATALMLGSRLSQLAGDHGWPRWRPNY